jgi:plastocyanin
MKALSRLAPILFLLSPLVFVAIGCSDSSNPTNPGGGGGGGPTFDTGTLSAPNLFVFTFTQDGTFAYRCKNHAVMTGNVMVSAAGSDSPAVHVATGGALTFNPATVNVKTGSYVRWIFDSGGHTVTRP